MVVVTQPKISLNESENCAELEHCKTRIRPFSTLASHCIVARPHGRNFRQLSIMFCLYLGQTFYLMYIFSFSFTKPVWNSMFQFTNIYTNTLVHSSPHLPVYCMGRWVRLHCFFFFQMGILNMIQHFMHRY